MTADPPSKVDAFIPTGTPSMPDYTLPVSPLQSIIYLCSRHRSPDEVTITPLQAPQPTCPIPASADYVQAVTAPTRSTAEPPDSYAYLTVSGAQIR